MREVERGPQIVDERVERVERVERIRNPPPPPRSSENVEERVVSPRRVPGDTEVEVVYDEEEEVEEVRSPPRRRDSDRRRVRRSSGYRSVDPNLYAGGNYPQHHIPRRRDSFSDWS